MENREDGPECPDKLYQIRVRRIQLEQLRELGSHEPAAYGRRSLAVCPRFVFAWGLPDLEAGLKSGHGPNAMKSRQAERLVFSGSLIFFAFLYGWGAGALAWFPGPIVMDAVSQGRAFFASPGYLVPRVYDRTGVRIPKPSRVQPGSTLIATLWPDGEDWTAGLNLIDTSGKVLHEWRVATAELFSGNVRTRGFRLEDGYIHGAHLFPNGDVLINVEAVGSVRLDACSSVLWAMESRSHHSIAADDDGSFWIPVFDYWDDAASLAQSGEYPGLEPPLVDNRIQQVAADGEVLKDISVLDVLYSNGLDRQLAKAGQSTGDIMHLNDVEPLSDSIAESYPLFEPGDILVSLRNTELVLVLDPETGIVKWHASGPFIQQHDPDFIGDGWIGLFDNNQDGTERGTMLGGSRVVALQPHTDSVEVLFPTEDSEPFYTTIAGKWQRLVNGNMLLTEAQASRIVEVAPDGTTVWEWIHQPADESTAVELSEGTRYSLSAEDVERWPCSPQLAAQRDGESP